MNETTISRFTQAISKLQKGSTPEASMLNAQYNLFKSLFEAVEVDLDAYGYVLDSPGDKENVVNTVMNVTSALVKSSNIPLDSIVDFVSQNSRQIRKIVLSKLEEGFEKEEMQKALSELTFHPEHVRAHEIEDEQGESYTEYMSKGARFSDLPEELQNHLRDYHMENKIPHVHVEGDEDPLIFGKSSTGFNEINWLHEVMHRFDEKAKTGEPVDDDEARFYYGISKGVYPGTDYEGVMVTPELSEHLNKSHGVDDYGNPRYDNHPLEVPMIGPSRDYTFKAQWKQKAEEIVQRRGQQNLDPLAKIRQIFEKGMPGEEWIDPVEQQGGGFNGAPVVESGVGGFDDSVGEGGMGGLLGGPAAPAAQPASVADRVRSLLGTATPGLGAPNKFGIPTGAPRKAPPGAGLSMEAAAPTMNAAPLAPPVPAAAPAPVSGGVTPEDMLDAHERLRSAGGA